MDFGFFSKFVTIFNPDKVVYDGDFSDRLNHHLTSSLLTMFMIMVSGKTYVGKPLQCAVPPNFNGAMEQYAENFCFVQNTYFIASGEEMPSSHTERDHREITYYQWVPFMLAGQALMFYLPCLLWRSLNWKSGIHVTSVVTLARAAQAGTIEDRKKKVSSMVAHLHEGLHTQKQGRKKWYSSGPIDRKRGNYLSTLFIFVKLLYVINIIAQFFLINSFISSKWTSFYGFDLLSDLAKGNEWFISGRFPRVTFCDFEMRVLGNVQRHTLQCVLMINMFNEKIYAAMWLWFMVVAVVTIVSFLASISQAFIRSRRVSLVHQTLKMSQAAGALSKRDVEDFTEECLRKDGVLMIRIISAGVGPTVAFDAVEALWNQYQSSKSTTDANSSHSRDD